MKRKNTAPSMFANTCEDLPLFSATPLEVTETPWNPQLRHVEQPTADMFEELPRAKLCGHLESRSVRAMRGIGGYQAE